MSLPSLQNFDANALAVPAVRRMHAYVPGEQPDTSDWIKLNTNENPFPASPRVRGAVEAAISGLTKYPSPTSQGLREAAARIYGLSANNVIVGNGSDDVLNLLVRAFAGELPVGSVNPGYSLYPVLASIVGNTMEYIPLDGQMQVDPELIKASKANLFFLTSPNAPTGVAVPNSSIAQILEVFEGVLVVDEAYADFAEENAIALLKKYPNLVVTRTFSKSYGLAGLRVGLALGHPSLIGVLDKVRDSYNVDGLAQAGAEAAIEDQAYFSEVIEKIKSIRETTRADFEKRGWFTYPSQANFLFTRPVNSDGIYGPEIAKSLFEFLKSNKVLVRYFPKSPVTDAFLRISIGTDAEMSTLSEIIDLWLSNA
ncbi:MAG: histidinol-phosphate transaminase [Opitutales bacterium]